MSGRTSAYNRVYPTFVLRQNTLETVYQSTAGGRQGVVYNNRLQEGELSGRLTVRYTLMPGADADYSAMAALLRERLAGRGVLTRSSGTQAPLLLDVVGAVETPQQVLGIPASVVTPLTRYDEVADMAAYFTDGGAGNLSVRLLGGTAGGEAHALRDHLRAESGLGGGQGFAAMAEALRTAGIQLYLQENFTAARREGLFDAFRKGTDAIRLLNRKYGRLYAPICPPCTTSVPLITR